MATLVMDEPKLRTVDWINPCSDSPTTIEEYRNEMTEAEKSGYISFEKHKQNMKKWLTTKIQ